MFLHHQFDDSSFSRQNLARDPEYRDTVRHNAQMRLFDNPEDLTALMLMGHVMVAEEEFEQARLHYLRAVKASPRFVPALMNCAAEYMRIQDFDMAEKFYRKAEAERPQSGMIASHLAICLLNQGDKTGAGRMLERAVELSPTYAPAHLYLAVMADRNGQYHEADEHALNAVAYAFEAQDFQIYTDAIAVHQRMQQKINGNGHNGHDRPESRY